VPPLDRLSDIASVLQNGLHAGCRPSTTHAAMAPQEDPRQDHAAHAATWAPGSSPTVQGFDGGRSGCSPSSTAAHPVIEDVC